MRGAAPIYATQRNPELQSEGALVEVAARAMGTPLIPWQRYVADVASERRPNGEYEHQVVVVSVPRQAGKTTLLRAVGVQRAVVNGRDVFYTAQTGKDARARWADMVKLLETSPAFKTRITVRRSQGSERVIFPGGAAVQAFAPTAESLHGYTPPTVMLDEAFAHNEAEGELLMGAIGPAQITVTDRQLWIVSTAGTAESAFLAAWLERGMAGAARVACFVWAADDRQDPYSAETIAAIHPAVGFRINGKTITPADVLAQADRNSRAEYERAYLNRATLTEHFLFPTEVLAPLDHAAAAPGQLVELPEDLGRIVLVYEVAFDRSAATITATWDAGGMPHTRVVERRPGTAWLPEAVIDLATRWRPAAIGADDSTPSPTREVTARLRDEGLDLKLLSGREYANACGSITARINTASVSIDGEDLEAPFLGLATRRTGDGDVFSRRLSVGDVSGAIATTVGTWLLEQLPTDQPAAIYFGASA